MALALVHVLGLLAEEKPAPALVTAVEVVKVMSVALVMMAVVVKATKSASVRVIEVAPAMTVATVMAAKTIAALVLVTEVV